MYENGAIHEPLSLAVRRTPPPSSYVDDPDDEVPEVSPEPWMLDSGTTFRILSQDTVNDRGYSIVELARPMNFNTANGQTWATQVVEFELLGAERLLHAFIIPTCAPCWLSTCQLTIHEGC